MRKRSKGRKLQICLLTASMLATSVGGTMVYAGTESGSTFAQKLSEKYTTDLSDKYAPEIRWWLAEGSHTDETLEDAVQKIKDMGFGGLEILTLTEDSVDVTKYGWGTEEWYHDTMVILKKANELGLSVSFTSGANWQPAVPGIDVNDDGVNKELDFSSLVLSAGQTYDDKFEPHSLGEGYEDVRQDLLQVVAVKLSDEKDADRVDLNSRTVSGFFSDEGDIETVYLDQDSTTVITDYVENSEDGYHLKWTAPDDGTYVVFGFWLHSTKQSATATNETSYVVNHVDKAGAEAMIKYWDNYMFTDEMQKLINENGDVDFFMDSLETSTTQNSCLYWSKDFLEKFKEKRGYDLTPYLPLIIQYNIDFSTLWVNYQAYVPRFDYNSENSIRQKVVNDVYMTQTELYEEEYLQVIREWLNKKNINLRAQVSYGFSTVDYEISTPIKSVDIPETETLEMSNTIDLYKTQSGAAHLSGKEVFSCETGALNGGTYSETMQEYLQMIYKAYAGGVNAVNLHGYATEAGPEDSTQWPGYEGIGFTTSERWGLRNPYGSDIKEFTTFLNRLQQVLRTGTQKMDIGILNTTYTLKNMDYWYGQHKDDYEEKMDEVTFWDDKTLGQAGYTYEYFSGDYLADETNKYEDGVYAKDGPAYQALVLYQESTTVSYVENLLKLAKEGMPVVVVEGAAATSDNYFDDDDEKLAQIMSELKGLSNVRVIAEESEIVSALEELGITPRVDYEESSELLTVLRQDTDGTSYIYAYNPTDEAIDVKVSFDGEGTPYSLDCWNGNVEAVSKYSQEDGRTSFNVKLEAGDVNVYVLDGNDTEERSVTETDAAGVTEKDGTLYLVAENSGDYNAVLSDGTKETVNAEVKTAELSGTWQLDVEDWQAGEKHTVTEERNGQTTTEVYYDTVKNPISVTLNELTSWDKIPEIGADVSGTGEYSTTFTVGDDWNEKDGLLLDLGEITQTAVVYVNGEKADAVNLTDPVVDISSLVKPGENELKIHISTTLNNRLIAMGRLNVGDSIAPFDAVEVEHYGLTDVKLISYQLAELQ